MNLVDRLKRERDRQAEIASLRSQVESYRDLAGEQQTKWATRCTTAEAEVERLRAALTDALQHGPEAPIDVDRWVAARDEIGGLRADLASRQIDVETFSEANRHLRAELASVRLTLDQVSVEGAADRAELAATKKKCREADERAFKRTNDTNNLREEIKDRDEYALLLHEQLDAFRAAARLDAEEPTKYMLWAEIRLRDGKIRQDAEEKARLREAIDGLISPYATLTEEALRDGILMEYGPPKPAKGLAVLRARAAIACRPQGEVFKSLHNDLPATSESADGLKSCRPQEEKS